MTTDYATTQVYTVYIKATPEKVWQAITDPEWNGKYGYKTVARYELSPGGSYSVHASPAMIAYGAPELMIDGEVLESDPPKRLVQTWRAFFSPETEAEGARRLTWELEPEGGDNVTKLTLTHELEGAPVTGLQVAGRNPEGGGGGWAWILSDLKTWLESGDPMDPTAAM